MLPENSSTVFKQPARLRRRAMRVLASTVQKGVPLVLILSKFRDTAHYTYVKASDSTLRDNLPPQGGRAEVGSFARPENGAPWRRGSWTLTSLPTDQWNQFKLLDEIAIRERAQAETEVWTRYYAPMGVIDQMRMVVVRRGRLLGWLGLIGDELYTAHDQYKANQVAPKLAAWMSEAASIEETLFNQHSAYIVTRADGHFEYASDTALHFLGEREEKIRHYLADIRPGVSKRSTFEGVELRVSAMRAPSG